jgi:hypothetical protein
MPNTANYSFPTPADTDLVKNGADAIRDLGDAVDTAMNTALGTKKSGMVLLSSVAFSAVAGFSLAANSFTTTYDNYRLTIKYTPSTDITPMRLRLRASGSDLTAASYGDNPFTTSATTAVAQGVSQTSARVVNLSTTDEAIIDLDIYTPASASLKTHWVGSSQRGGTSGDRFFGAYTVATAADSLTIYPNTGTITGSYSLYGYNK